MIEYQEMYAKLFQAVTQAIEILKKAQQDTEDMYLTHEETKIMLIDPSHNNGDDINNS